MKILNRKCVKCGKANQPGVLLMKFNSMYLCGECFHKKMMKQRQEREELFLTE